MLITRPFFLKLGIINSLSEHGLRRLVALVRLIRLRHFPRHFVIKEMLTRYVAENGHPQNETLQHEILEETLL